jgi:urease accessory protein UreF
MDALRTETRAMSRTIGEKLHRCLESLVKDLLPERWVELIRGTMPIAEAGRQ